MTTSATMLDAGPHRPPIDTQQHGDTIDVLVEVARTARQCADACLRTDEPELHRCIALNQDVADLATAASAMLIRLAEPEAVVAVLDACRAALRACADTCRSHSGHLRNCAVCAEVCDRAEDLCLRAATSIAHAAAPQQPRDDATAGQHAGHRVDIVAERPGQDQIHLISDGDIGDGAD